MTPRFHPPENTSRTQLLIVAAIMLVLVFAFGIVPAVMPWRASL